MWNIPFRQSFLLSNTMSMLTDADISATQRKRDVADEFTLARAEFNPFSTMVRKGRRPISSLYEEPYKARFTPTDNAVLDGQDVVSADFQNNEANKCMLQGRVQKGRVAIAVSDLVFEVGEEYAATDLLADNMQDGLVLCRESLELTCLKAGDSCPQNDPNIGPAAHMRGMTSWIRSSNPNNGDLPVNAIALAPAGNILAGIADPTTITDTTFNTIMQSIATAAFMKGTWDVFVSPTMMAIIDGFTNMGVISGSTVPLRRFNKDIADTTLTMEVRFYQTSFGKLRFHLHYTLPVNGVNGATVTVHALIVQMEHVMLRPVYPVRTRELPYLGGGYKRIIEYVNGLDCTNPKAHGKITT